MNRFPILSDRTAALRPFLTALVLGSLAGAAAVRAGDAEPAAAPVIDRVGFPTGYAEKFQVLRTVTKTNDLKVVTVYGNPQASAVTNAAQLPYPYGSVLVMETASAAKSTDGKPLFDARGNFQRGKVLGLHVMRREQGFGKAYGEKRSGEWEFVEYREDVSFITPPQKSADCAACHIKAGAERDFVYRGRFPALSGK